MKFEQGNTGDLEDLRALGLKSWGTFQNQLTPENWERLYASLNDLNTYRELLARSHCFICRNEKDQLIGMAFLVPSGHPTEIYDKTWAYLRFVSVDPEYAGRGIGKGLTLLCIEEARKMGEQVLALHTSEMMQAARHIYESLGFAILKELEPRLGKRYWLYRLHLAEQ